MSNHIDIDKVVVFYAALLMGMGAVKDLLFFFSYIY